MAPKRGASYEVGEKAMSFHGPMLYESKVIEVGLVDEKDKKQGHQYFVHYKGWKNTWDSWVPEDRMRKLNDENVALAKQLEREVKGPPKSEQKKNSTASGKRKSGAAENGSGRMSEDRSSNVQAASRGVKRPRDPDMETEDHFQWRQSIRIPLPDNLKSLLVDDWENVTKNQQIVPLPHPYPVSDLLKAYYAHESSRRNAGSPEADILEEVISGITEYFDTSLGRILLYRFERPQWLEMCQRMEADEGKGLGPAIKGGVNAGTGNNPDSISTGKSPAKGKTNAARAAKGKGNPKQSSGAESDNAAESNDANDSGADPAKDPALTDIDRARIDLSKKKPHEVYGAEHFCRLLVTMPEMVAQTNMDAQAVKRLKEEIAKMTAWLSQRTNQWFVQAYEDTSLEYKALTK